MTPYYEGFVRARRALSVHEASRRRIAEVVVRPPGVRFRVGVSLVSLGHHLMGVTAPEGRPEMRPAA